MDEDRNNIQLEDSPHQTIHMNSSSSSSNSNGSGTMLDAEASQPARWNDQLKGVLKKNLRLYTHKKSLWASVIILPPVLMLVVFFYTKLIMAFEKPVSAYRSPITNYPAVLLPKFSFTTSAAACTQQKTPCILAVSPDTLETRALASKVRETLYDDQTGRMPPLFFYENSTALLTAMNTEGERFFGGISFHDGDVKNGSYTLYMKSSLLPQDAYESRPNIYNGGMYSLSNASLYFSSGFATLQSALDLSTLHNGPGAEGLNVTLRSKVLPGWEKNAIAPTLSMLICLMVLVSYSPLMTNGATLVTNENVSKTRQYLFTLGLKRWVYWLSWVLTLFVPSIIIALLWVLCGLVGSTLSIGGAVYMSFYYAFFSLSIIMVVLIVQCVVKTVMWSTAISSAFLVLPPVIGSLLPAVKWAQCLASFFSSYTLYLAVMDTTSQELNGVSVSSLSPTEVIVYVVFDTAFYGAVAWYLNEVFTGDYGVPKSPLFVFDKGYWKNFFGLTDRGHSHQTDINIGIEENEEKEEANKDFEAPEDRGSARAGIVLHGLTKTFNNGNVVAVDSATGSFCRGKITCLLGQNGAGKTTLISSLYGLIKPNAGTAFVNGQDITTDIDSIRSSIGVCPQDNILYPELNAQDHIDLVMALKGVHKTDESAGYVKGLIEDLGLFESAKPDDPVSGYSGGMKRKLSLIMALIGNSKVIFLDEPTSGVDPVSKRSIWGVLSRAKEGRTIILTTHSMEEAENLSDYIYIMVNGKFRCGGSPMFLKHRFGVGYYLSTTKRPGCNVSALRAEIENFVPDVTVEKDVNDTVSFRLPFSDVPQFSQLFDRLENAQEELGIDGFGLSLSTIEDVFVRICSQADSVAAPDIKSTADTEDDEKDPYEKNSDISDDDDEKNLLLEEQDDIDDKLSRAWKNTEFKRASFLQQFVSLCKFKLMFYKRNPSNIWAIIAVPLLNMLFTFIILSLTMSLLQGDTKSSSFHSVLEYAPTYVPYTVAQPSQVVQTDINSFVESINGTAPDRLRMEYVADISELEKMALANRDINFGLIINEFNMSSKKADITLMYNQTERNTPVDIVNLVYAGVRAVLTNTTGEINGLWVQQTSSSSVELTGTLTELVNGLIATFIVIIVYLLVAMKSLEIPIRDRACGVKAQMYISCMRPAAYVLSTILVSILTLVPSFVITEILLGCFGVKVFTCSSGFFVLTLGTTLFFVALTSFNHCFSNLFKNPTTASNWNFLVLYGMMLVPAIVYAIILAIKALLALSAFVGFICDLVIFVLGFSPTYSFFLFLVSLVLQGSGYSIPSRLMWDNSLARSLMMLGLDAMMYLIISISWEYKWDAITTNASQDVSPTKHSEDHEDEDVVSEQRRVETGLADMDNVVIDGLRKVYKPRTVAVQNLTLGIPENECFGLLGPNGSGKTTTINAITAEIPITRGKVTVNGAELCGRRSHFFAQACVSRCPQGEGLVESMTGRDHLELMARLRADMPRSQVKKLVKGVITAIGLEKDADKEVRAYSGGTARKLCVAVAMLPGAAVTVLDEPSTGMDVVSRRALWDFVQKGRRTAGKSFILTTHSMEEAESVCTTIGIISHGALQCIGSPQRLKDRHSEGYIVTLGTGPDTDVGALERIVLGHSGEPKLRVGYASATCRMYDVKKVTSLARLFADLEAATHTHRLRSYTVSQASLETVFLHVIKDHETDN